MPPVTPEQRAREDIDRLLAQAGWHVCDFKAANIRAALGVAIREFELSAGHGTAYYDQTKNFTPFETIEACLKSGGRKPKQSNSGG